uniref:hypothetical protein n=1 Tax=Pseudorhodobacter aquimaris TaxID=687412 RepID=UPI000A44DFB8|nr:hypothetical protein [Pseudorhodobacter aquimaris]
MLADCFEMTSQTIYKWRQRDSVEDRSHAPHRLQTTLTPAKEVAAVALRKTLLVSLDGLLAMVQEFLNPNVSRPGLDRRLHRHGVGTLRDGQAKNWRRRCIAMSGSTINRSCRQPSAASRPCRR